MIVFSFRIFPGDICCCYLKALFICTFYALGRYLIMCNFEFTMMAYIFCRPHFHILCNAVMLVVVTHIDPLHHYTSFAILQLHRFPSKFSFVSTSTDFVTVDDIFNFNHFLRRCDFVLIMPLFE